MLDRYDIGRPKAMNSGCFHGSFPLTLKMLENDTPQIALGTSQEPVSDDAGRLRGTKGPYTEAAVGLRALLHRLAGCQKV
jgi:hypothetical protein